MITSAFINIWEQRVGAIAWDASTGFASIEFDPLFLKTGWDLAPIHLPIASAAGRVFSSPELRNNGTFKGMPGLLADVLPDRYGNTLINAWLSQQGRAVESMNPVEVLCFIGKRGMGALEFEPVRPKIEDSVTDVEIDAMVRIADTILSGRSTFEASLTSAEENTMLNILKIGTSAGGARAKALIAYNSETGAVKSGQAAAPAGFEHWLIKFDGIHDQQFGSGTGYGRVEMAYHHMAVDCGIEMTECRLLEENDRAHFMTRRFDRQGGEKIHYQSFCAMNHYDFNNITSYGYEHLFETMRALRLPYSAAEQLFRRMVFNALARNCDDHTKNFAFLYHPEQGWRLSPAFDVCYAYRPDSYWVSRQSLSINGKRENFTFEDFTSVAKQMNIKKAPAIIHEISDTISNWMNYAEQQRVNDQLAAIIAKNLLSLQ